MKIRHWPGSPYPLGATWDGEGVNFAVYSEHAERMELCLFSAHGRETHRIVLKERTNRVWHGYFPDLGPGQRYGFRAYGPYEPLHGLRYNGNKLLIDPYAKAIDGAVKWDKSIFGYDVDSPQADLSFSKSDSAPFIPKSIVVDSAFTWKHDKRPAIPWSKTVIYECHVKGMTMLHPDVPPELRGTYRGLCSEPVIDHLKRLGVTTVELLPVHHYLVEHRLGELGLTNYWGYNTIGYFAPDPRYASAPAGQQVAEFKAMVKAFHREGLEVILDVVYNHTGEGHQLGPTISLKGLDNRTYYSLVADNQRYYMDFTGCGNSLYARHPRTLQLILDSLRYWVEEMHIDGFRFDLAVTLGRNPIEFDNFSRFFAVVQQDPVLSTVKLIAEPWDVGPGGYRVGAFPHGWAEWNGRYRDAIRRFWRGDHGVVPEMASRLSGSSDIFQPGGRGPFSSVNFVTCHDGFSLADLVSYEQKHNLANAEDNRDGDSHNNSRNWGVEGPTENPAIQRLRDRAVRNLMATLAFSQGVPMISHGDEVGRTQLGNNNAYCQDSPLTWVNWELTAGQRELLEFTRKVFALRRENPVFRRRRYFATGESAETAGEKDVTWLRPDGAEMSEADWTNAGVQAFGMLVRGEASDEVDERGSPNLGQTLLLLANAGTRARGFTTPQLRRPGTWREEVNTAAETHRTPKGRVLNVPPNSLVLLRYEEEQ